MMIKKRILVFLVFTGFLFFQHSEISLAASIQNSLNPSLVANEETPSDVYTAETPTIGNSNQTIQIEADYILECQIIDNPNYPLAYGAINNVRGYNPDYPQPDYIIPGENAMAIFGLIVASQVLNSTVYMERANLAADYFVSVQNPDGSWYNKYDYIHGHDQGESPRHTAELMMAFYKLGYNPLRYNSMIQAADYLESCFNSALNLINGGKDANGIYLNEYWLTDNCFAYHAFMAAYSWARTNGNIALALEYAGYAGNIINGINTSMKDTANPVWYERIDQFGNPIENSQYPNWIKYAPLLYDVPVDGVNSSLVGEWIHNTFQQADGSCIGYVYDSQGNKTNTRKYPGLCFQAALCWQQLGLSQAVYAQDAINWAVNSGLWKLDPDPVGVIGGWIDWIELEPNPGDMPQDWERYIDTSALSILAFKGGFDFSTATFVLRVPDNYPNIQSAIDAAWDGCVVLVADGVYTGDGNWDINFLGKKITVKSENGADTTIIDGASSHQGFNFHSGEDQNSLLQGFTVQNGSASFGGGMYFTGNSTPIIKDCKILNNTAAERGGGVFCYSAPTFINCLIKGNRTNLYDGGGIACELNSGSATFINCTIEENSSSMTGAGVQCFMSSPTFNNCVFKNNQAASSGGAIACYDGSHPIITDSTFFNNEAIGGAGAALYCGLNSNPTLTRCLMYDNVAVSSASDGGAIYTWNSAPKFYNCTITRNSADRSGGAIGVLGDGAYRPEFKNCILWDNSPNEIYVFAGNIPVNYSDIKGGYIGTNNINANPLFVDALRNNFRLQRFSPCINTGDPSSPRDPDGTRADMGAFFYDFRQRSGCFLAGTPVLMADGSSKSIEKIKVGDTVIAFNQDKGKMVKDKVKKLFVHDADEYLIVNGHLKVTPNHRVYSKGNWIEIGKLKIGDTLQNAEGKPEKITDIQKRNEHVKVYNLEVNPYHTYFAGGYLVHNRKLLQYVSE